MLEVRELSTGYTPKIDILKGIDLTVGRAEIVSLLGPNGCGKSTLLKCIAGYISPRKGNITIDGDDTGHMPIHHKIRHCSLGFVPQTDNVFGKLSVKENLLIGGHFLRPKESSQRIDQLCDLYPVLARKIRTVASALSGGERQILALARALMPSPKTLLLDEPSAGLSPRMLEEVFEAISQIRGHEEVSILMVEQNAVEALKVSDRAYVLSLGEIALSGHANVLLQDKRMQELYLGGRAA